MAMNKSELAEIVEELEDYRGKHTELISVYISEGYDINAVQKQLEAEKATAKNIKSPGTRKNVIDALEKMVRELKEMKNTPENGLALFCGDISPTEGQQNLQFWAIEPPVPLKTRLYRCDKDFVLEPLKEMLEADEVFGLLVMDRKEATIGLLEGKHIEVFQKLTSGVPSQVRAGGQSSQRFHRITEGLTKDFYKRVAEEMKKIFFEMPRLKGILVGGPVPTKDEFLDGDYFATKLKQKVIGRIDLGDTSESGLKELVEKSQEILEKQEIMQEKREIKRFFEALAKTSGMASIDLEYIKKSLLSGAVDTILISEKTNRKISKELKQKAKNTGAEINIISIETDEGKQFQNMGGIGAILRFKI